MRLSISGPLRGPFVPRFYTYGGVSLSSAAFVETRRATSPLQACSRPWCVETHSCVSSRDFAYPSPLMQPFLLAETQECVSTFTVVPSLLSGFCRDAARHVSIYNNVRARASLEEVQPSKGSGGMMRYCIKLGWFKPVRGSSSQKYAKRVILPKFLRKKWIMIPHVKFPRR